MTETSNLSLNLLYQHQLHKEVLINENAIITDAMMFSGVKSMAISQLPNDGAIGDKYILAEQGKIAVKLEDIWHYINAKEGMVFWVIDEAKLVVFSNGGWKKIA